MLTETSVVLTTNQKSEFLGRFEALEYVENVRQIQKVRLNNKTPILVKNSSAYKKTHMIGGCKVVEVPEELIGNIEAFTDFCHYNHFECGDYFTGVMYDTTLERCFLCEITNYKGFDSLKRYNQFVDKTVDCIIYESPNFFVVTEKGALKQGFLMIVPKKHYYSAAQFPEEIISEYKEVCKDIETILLKTFKGKSVIFMEHGSSSSMSSSRESIVHAHIHVVIDFTLKSKYRKMVQLVPCDDISMAKDIRYFSYQEGTEGQLFVTLNDEVYIQHQYGRQVMAHELKYAPEQYNWRYYDFDEIIDATLFHLYKFLRNETEGRICERTKDFVQGFSKRTKKKD